MPHQCFYNRYQVTFTTSPIVVVVLNPAITTLTGRYRCCNNLIMLLQPVQITTLPHLRSLLLRLLNQPYPQTGQVWAQQPHQMLLQPYRLLHLRSLLLRLLNQPPYWTGTDVTTTTSSVIYTGTDEGYHLSPIVVVETPQSTVPTYWTIVTITSNR